MSERLQDRSWLDRIAVRRWMRRNVEKFPSSDADGVDRDALRAGAAEAFAVYDEDGEISSSEEDCLDDIADQVAGWYRRRKSGAKQ